MIFLIATMEASTWLSISWGATFKLWGNIIDLIDGEPKRLRMTSKPNETDSQTNIYIEVVNRIYGKTKSMLDWPLYTPSPNRECLYKVASPGKTPETTESMLDWPQSGQSNIDSLFSGVLPGLATL